MKRVLGLFLICSLACPTLAAGDDKVVSRASERSEVFVTVYNTNLALVREVRDIEMPKGEVTVEFEDVAKEIRPETVAIKAADKAGLDVLEQNYEYDLLTPQRLMDKYEGLDLKLVKENPKTGEEKKTSAVLLSNQGGGVFKTSEGITFGDVGRPLIPKLPGNFVTHPTLRWMLLSQKAGKRKVEAAYLTGGLSWKADYVLVLDKSDKSADLKGWVTLDNNSGATYADANLALVAGDVNQAQPQYPQRYAMVAMKESRGAGGFQEEGLFEYHLYTLERPTTIADRQQKQVSLLEAAGVAVKSVLKVRGQYLQLQSRLGPGADPKQQVEAFIELKNSQQHGLGMPLPAGIVRVYKADSRGGQQFLGEDRIDHTPKDEKVEIKVGNAFDVVAERVQKDYKRISDKVHQTEWEVKIRNHKKQKVTVQVEEPMSGDWEVLKSSHKAVRKDASKLTFKVDVMPNAETVITYRVQTKY